MTLARKLQQLVEDLSVIDDPQERLAAVVDRARKQAPLPEGERTDANRVRGCVSVVWIAAEHRDARCYFRSDAESPVVRGLLALLAGFYSGHTAEEIVAADADPLDGLGLLRNLSPTRRNGLTAARDAIRMFARKHLRPE